MNIEIRYFSKTGNTKKLADAIALATGTEAKTVNQPLLGKTDILFLGSSVYAAGVDEEIKAFIKSLDKEQIGHVVNFSTAALLPSTYKQVEKLLKQRGILLDTNEFHCRGSFHMMHKGKPDKEDLEAVKKFAKQVVERYQ